MSVSGRDYPRTWEQFLDWFPDEAACTRYLEGIRWCDGFVCPRCGVEEEAYRVSRNRLMCRDCRYQCTATAGTVFDKTRTSLQTWLAAVWYITNQKQGVNALGLQRVLGLGSYQTAWAMLHRLRRAMIRPGRELLSGLVEVDESYVGRSVATRGPAVKAAQEYDNQAILRHTIVAVAVEIKTPKGFGRIRLRRVTDTSQASMLPFVKDSIEPGSVIHTDGSWAYRSLRKNGYRLLEQAMLTEPVTYGQIVSGSKHKI